jgi:hypothetical protein
LFILPLDPANANGQPKILTRQIAYLCLKLSQDGMNINGVTSYQNNFWFLYVGAEAYGSAEVLKQLLEIFNIIWYRMDEKCSVIHKEACSEFDQVSTNGV